MKTVLYIDVLLLVNFIIDYFLLLCAKQISGAQSSRLRLAAAAILGSLFSLAILLPPFPLWGQIAFKVISGVFIVLAAYRYIGVRHFCKVALWFLTLSFVLGGVAVFAMFTFSISSISVNNLNLYFDVSPVLLLSCMLAVYLAVQLLTRLFPPPSGKTKIKAQITVKDKCFTAIILYDTGFQLRGVLGGKPVLLLYYEACKENLPACLQSVLEEYKRGTVPSAKGLSVSFVPFRTASGEGVFPAVAAQRVLLMLEGRSQEVTNVLLAFTWQPIGNGEFSGLMGEELAMKIT